MVKSILTGERFGIRSVSEHFNNHLLETIVRKHLPEDNYVFTPTPTGHFSSTFFVDSPDEHYVLRIAPPDDAGFLFYERRMMLQEPRIHRMILECTSVPIPQILVYDDSRTLINRDYLIMDRLPGVPASQLSGMPGSDWARILYQVGVYLRETHEIKATQYGYLGEHRCMEPQNDWVSAFYVMWNKLLDDVYATDHYSSEETVYIKGLLDKHLRHFDRPVDSSLLHMDIWSQNILVEGPKVTGIIDWDRVCWGDPEIEFAILDYCGISEPSFWEGYKAERDISEPAQIRRIFYLLYELQKYIVIYHWRENDPATCRRYKRQSIELVGKL